MSHLACCVPPPPPPQVCNVLGADGMVYQDVNDLMSVGHELNPEITTFDASCFDGKYVTGGPVHRGGGGGVQGGG